MRRADRPGDFDEDIKFHIEEETAGNLARGMMPEEARSAALRKFGNVLQAREAVREVWIPAWADQAAMDLRYAMRTYRRSKMFSLTVLLMIALGIAINTSVFSIVNVLLLRPLPYPDSARLVAYSDGITADKAERFKPGVNGADFAEWRSRATSFQQLAGYRYQDSTLSTPTEARRVRVVTTAGDFWPLNGVMPAKGRYFNDAGQPDGAILSHRIFTQLFGADDAIIGGRATLGGKQVTIAGVLPPDFRFLYPQERPGFEWSEADVFVPSAPLLRGERSRLFVVGKLKPDVPIQSALSELKGIQETILKAYPDRWFAGPERMTLVPLQEHLAGRAAQALTILQIAGLFVMLIACANIANLLLARTASRQREVSIRMAIGAGKGRVLRQFFCEGLLLAAAGGVAGVFLAKAMLWAMIQWGSKALPRLAEAELDSRVLAFTFVLSVASAMLFCFGPAAALWRMDIQMALKDRGADSAGKPGGMRMRRGLVVLELAIAVILAVGAGLMIRSFSVMYSKIAGFEPARTLVMQLAITGGQYKEKSRLVSTIQEIIAEIESLPGVQSAAIAERQVYLLQSADSAVPNVVDQFEESLVSPGYFSAIGMKLVAGRWIEAGDPADAAVINETLAKKVFGSQDPIGQFIQNFGRPVRVVGVAANLKYSKMDADPGPELYRGYAENLAGFPSLSIVARVKGDPLAIAEAARARVTAVAPQQAVHGIRTLGDALSDSIAPRRFNLVLLIGFAGAALLMATIGIYGVVSYSVSQRTKEIGLRMALGATRRQIATLIIGGGMSFILAGIVTGLGGAYALTRWMASLLYGVEPHDFSTFAVVPVLLGVTALLACAVPAARAARVDPLVSLRQE